MANQHEKDSFGCSPHANAELLKCNLRLIGLIRKAHIRTLEVGLFHGIASLPGWQLGDENQGGQSLED